MNSNPKPIKTLNHNSRPNSTDDVIFTFVKVKTDRYDASKNNYLFEIDEKAYYHLLNCNAWTYSERYFVSFKYSDVFKFKPEQGDLIKINLENDIKHLEYAGKKYIKFAKKKFNQLFDKPINDRKVW